MKESTKNVLGVLFAVLIFWAAISVEFFTVCMFLKAREVKNWPTTKGTLIKSKLTSEFHVTLEAQIEYEYRVGEKLYKSKQVRTRGTSTKDRSDIAPLVAKFPVGQEVHVYYNPKDPSDAYLEAGVDLVNYVIIVSPLIFAFWTGSYLVESFRQKQVLGPNKHTEPNAPLDGGSFFVQRRLTITWCPRRC